MSKNLHSHQFERKTLWVVFITAITMVVEIIAGLFSSSMALLADGIHMGSHVLAIGLSWFAYTLVRKYSQRGTFNGNTDKILSLAGFTSGLLLLVFAVVIIIEAAKRFLSPQEIMYKEALVVAVIGLIVNITCAFILHHDHKDSDHNIRAAYLHVLADALTSLAAIAGITSAMIFDIAWIDTLCAIISSLVIIRWSFGLLKNSGKHLLDIQK